MTQRKPTLTSKNHGDMDSFLGHILDEYKNNNISKLDAVSYIAHTIAAIDLGNYGEAINWFEQGRKLMFLSTPSGR